MFCKIFAMSILMLLANFEIYSFSKLGGASSFKALQFFKNDRAWSIKAAVALSCNKGASVLHQILQGSSYRDDLDEMECARCFTACSENWKRQLFLNGRR